MEELAFYTNQCESISQYQSLLNSYSNTSNSRSINTQTYDDNYGGAYINDNGDLVVLLVSSTTAEINQVRATTNNEELITLDCEYSYNHLIDVINTINANLDYLSRQNITITSMYEDVYTNSVKINVKNLTPVKENIIRTIVNSPCMIIANGIEITETVTAIKGGDSVNNSTGSSTIGFCATTNDGYGFVIAGHHAGSQTGGSFYHNGTYIGKVTATAYYSGSTADAAFIAQSSNATTTGLIGTYRCEYLASSLADYPVGARISKIGITTGTTHGNIISNYYTSTSATGVYFTGQVTASFKAEAGDSGGPVFIIQDVINGQLTCKLLGIQKAIHLTYGDDGYYAVFSKLTNIEEELDVQVVTY